MGAITDVVLLGAHSYFKEGGTDPGPKPGPGTTVLDHPRLSISQSIPTASLFHIREVLKRLSSRISHPLVRSLSFFFATRDY